MASPGQGPGSANQKSCFVVMPITTPSSYIEKYGDEEHFTHVLDHLFEPALAQTGYKVIPPTVAGSELIHAEIIRNLEQADLVLCDLSSLNANVFFELGIRTSLDRSVVLVKDNQTPAIPFDLTAVNVMTYDASLAPWALAKEIGRLAAHVESAMLTGDKGNAMWRHFGLTKRAQPTEGSDNPIETKLDILLEELRRSQYRPEPYKSNYREETAGRLLDEVATIMRRNNIDLKTVETDSDRIRITARRAMPRHVVDMVTQVAQSYGLEFDYTVSSD